MSVGSQAESTMFPLHHHQTLHAHLIVNIMGTRVGGHAYCTWDQAVYTGRGSERVVFDYRGKAEHTS